MYVHAVFHSDEADTRAMVGAHGSKLLMTSDAAGLLHGVHITILAEAREDVLRIQMRVARANPIHLQLGDPAEGARRSIAAPSPASPPRPIWLPRHRRADGRKLCREADRKRRLTLPSWETCMAAPDAIIGTRICLDFLPSRSPLTLLGLLFTPVFYVLVRRIALRTSKGAASALNRS